MYDKPTNDSREQIVATAFVTNVDTQDFTAIPVDLDVRDAEEWADELGDMFVRTHVLIVAEDGTRLFDFSTDWSDDPGNGPEILSIDS